MVLIFKYKTVKRPDGTLAKIPCIPVCLQHKTSFDTIALLDSGAEVSTIPKEVGEILGLDLSGKTGISYGIGGAVNSVERLVVVTIQNHHEKYSFKIPFKIVLDKYDFPVIMGRAGFFDKFLITIDEGEEKVKLKRKTRHSY